MRLITKRSLIRGVPEAWKRQYPRPEPDKKLIQEQLDALNLNSVHEDVIRDIIGNGSWTAIWCNECRRDVQSAVEIGEPPDRESSTAIICRPCLKKAANLKR